MRVNLCDDGFIIFDPRNPSKLRLLKLFTKKVAREYYWYAHRFLDEDCDFEKADSILQFINYLLDKEAKKGKIDND